MDPRNSPSLSPAQSDNQGLQGALRSLSLSIMVERRRHTNWTPEQPVWKAGGVNPDVTPVLSVRPPRTPLGRTTTTVEPVRWSVGPGGPPVVGTEKVGAQGDYQRVDDNFVRPLQLSAIWHPPPQIVPPWSTQTEGTERRIVVIAFGHLTLFAPLSQSVQTKQCRQCMEPSIRNKWGELCFSAKTTKTTAWQPPKFRSGKTEWINVEWEKEHHYTGFALIWHQRPTTA